MKIHMPADGGTGEVRATIAIPLSALAALAPVPIAVSQDTVGALFGVSRRVYLEAARRKEFRSTRLGKHIIADVVELRRWLGLDAAPERATAAPANDVAGPISDTDAALLAAGARGRR